MTESELISLAVHEAGHAVMAWLCHIPVTSVQIMGERKAPSGGDAFCQLAHDVAPVTDAVIAFAGDAAEAAFEYNTPGRLLGMDEGRLQGSAFATDTMRRQVLRMMRAPAIQDAVGFIALSLIEHGRLSGAQFEHLMQLRWNDTPVSFECRSKGTLR